MRVLLVTLGVPGFLAPMFSVAHALVADGHEVAFVTDVRMTDIIEGEGFRRFACGERDGPSFQIESWGSEINIALQVKHVEYALAQFPADVICASHLTLGPLIVRERYGIPLGILGSAVLLWDPEVHIGTQLAPGAWRYVEMLQSLERAREFLGLTPTAHDVPSPLLADAFFVQGVPALQVRADELPSTIRFVGTCACTPAAFRVCNPSERMWFSRQRARDRRIVFVQLGRTFGRGAWAARLLSVLRTLPVACAIAKGRFEDELVLDEHDALLLDEALANDDVLARVDAAVVTGQPSAVLAAIVQARPLVIVASGSGAEEIGEALQRYGCAIVLDAECGDAALAAAVDRVIHEPTFSERARELAEDFARLDGPRAVARALYDLARSRATGGGFDARTLA